MLRFTKNFILISYLFANTFIAQFISDEKFDWQGEDQKGAQLFL